MPPSLPGLSVSSDIITGRPISVSDVRGWSYAMFIARPIGVSGFRCCFRAILAAKLINVSDFKCFPNAILTARHISFGNLRHCLHAFLTARPVSVTSEVVLMPPLPPCLFISDSTCFPRASLLARPVSVRDSTYCFHNTASRLFFLLFSFCPSVFYFLSFSTTCCRSLFI